MKIAKDITELIGNTPLIRLRDASSRYGVNIYAKCEFTNPTSSIKDRAAYSMIKDAILRGLIDSSTTIIEPTSGNTGIALAAICASMGIKLILTMPESMSLERRKLLSYFGAKLELTSSSEGMSGAIKRANELQESIKNSIVLAQFDNMANPLIHYETTAIEIIEALDGKVDAFVASVGTGGTLSGVAKRLKEEIKDIKIFAAEPLKSAVLSGQKASSHAIQGIGAGFIPKVCNIKIFDEVIKVSDEDAIICARNIAKNEGLLVGISSGANIYAAMQVAKKGGFENIVTVLPDTGERYLSTVLFDE